LLDRFEYWLHRSLALLVLVVPRLRLDQWCCRRELPSSSSTAGTDRRVPRANRLGPRSHLRLCLPASVSLFNFLVSSALVQAFTRMVVLGDSLSDPGNHFIEFGTTQQAPFVPITYFSYNIGGHHFSNGAT